MPDINSAHKTFCNSGKMQKPTFFTSISFPYKSLKQRFSVSPLVNLHQYKFSACKSADDCKQFFCAFCGCFARIYRNLYPNQRISEMDLSECVLNKKPRFSLFLSHSSPDDWKIHKALESKILQKHTPKYPKSLFLKIENIKVLWKTASENNLKKYDFELHP